MAQGARVHLAQSGDSCKALVASGAVLNGFYDEWQDIPYVGAQPRTSHSGQLSRGCQHTGNHSTFPTACQLTSTLSHGHDQCRLACSYNHSNENVLSDRL